nr:MAG TPA: hypothetical protein [Caudoviricetes sp.]
MQIVISHIISRDSVAVFNISLHFSQLIENDY